MNKEQIDTLKDMMKLFKNSNGDYREHNKAILIAYLDGVLSAIK